MKRYSLKSLFTVSTILIVLLGYTQWRRHRVQEKCKELSQLGIVIAAPNKWQDSFWQRAPRKATIYTDRFFTISDYPAEHERAAERIRGLEIELRQLGVTSVKTLPKSPNPLWWASP